MPETPGSLKIILISENVYYIAKWNGSAWSSLDTGTVGYVYALACDGSGNLYAGGNFTTAGGVSVNYIAKWNGSAWSTLGTGMSNAVYALACDSGGNLYAGGMFANYIAKWDGSAWSTLGTGMDSWVYALAFDSSGKLYAGGMFVTAGGVSANRTAKWNGSAWSALGTGMNNHVFALACYGSGNVYVYAGGQFTSAGGSTSNNIARYGFAAEPTTQASVVNFTSVTSNSMKVEWTRGTGANCIVVMKSGSNVDSNPVDGTSYTADAAFGSGSPTGTDNYVVYNSTGNSVTVTGLTAETTYHVAVYEVNGSGGTENYLITSPATGNRTTLASEPATQASAVNFTAVDSTSMTVNWTRGGGANCIAVMKSGSAVDSNPIDGTSCTADAAFGSGSPTGTGNYVVHNGTGNSVTVTGLTAGTTCHVAVYEFNGSGGTEDYLITSPATGNRTNLAWEPTGQALNVTFDAVTAASMTVNWARGSGSNCIVVMKAGGNVDSNPVDGTSYTANAAFGSGSLTGTGNYVVHNGTGNSVAVTGLTAGTTYHVAVYEFNGSGGSENYLTTFPPPGNRLTDNCSFCSFCPFRTDGNGCISNPDQSFMDRQQRR